MKKFEKQKLNREDHKNQERIATVCRVLFKIGTAAGAFAAGEKFLIIWGVMMIIWKIESK